MTQKRILWQLYPLILFSVLLTLGGAGWYAIYTTEQFFLKKIFLTLQEQIKQTEAQVLPFLSPLKPQAIDQICRQTAQATGKRVTLVLSHGKVVGDSHNNPARMDNQHIWPEVSQAAKGKTSYFIRTDKHLKQRLLYVAAPVGQSAPPVAIIKMTTSLTDLDTHIKNIKMHALGWAIAMAFIVLCLCFIQSKNISRPIAVMQRFVENLTYGNPQGKLTLFQDKNSELGKLAEAINKMAKKTSYRIKTTQKQKSEYEAVLASMAEGVIAIDTEERIININHSAIKILGISPVQVRGKTVQETIRSARLQKIVKQALETKQNFDTELTLIADEEIFFHVRASGLYDTDARQIGVLLVFNDITPIKRLEKIRKDFVANASHEIKTPLTAIKGFVETLLHGAITDKKKTMHFLHIVAKHTNRLSDIVQDLLLLSRVEKQDELHELVYREVEVDAVIRTSVEFCQPRASQKKIQLKTATEAGVVIHADPRLMEQALINLLDNAVKYSPENSIVSVSVEKSPQKIILHVTDEGGGIARNHLERVFERFYRVDSARSRDLGGTGLGLSIVKYIAKAHRGDVSVKSTPGKGSTFSIHLPRE